MSDYQDKLKEIKELAKVNKNLYEENEYLKRKLKKAEKEARESELLLLAFLEGKRNV